MKKQAFKFFFQSNKESILHTEILRQAWLITGDDAEALNWTFHMLEVYFGHLLRTNLEAAAEMFRAIDVFEEEYAEED